MRSVSKTPLKGGQQRIVFIVFLFIQKQRRKLSKAYAAVLLFSIYKYHQDSGPFEILILIFEP